MKGWCVCVCVCVCVLVVRDVLLSLFIECVFNSQYRIHFETSSVLIRQLPVEVLKKPDNWPYAPPIAGIVDTAML